MREMMVITSLVSQLLQPNLTFNLDETDRRREEAYISVKPVFIKIARNEMLVREGQRVGRDEMIKLNFHHRGGTDRHWSYVFLTILAFSAVCISVVVHVTKQHLPLIRADPDWPVKAKEGREKELVRCVACNWSLEADSRYEKVNCNRWPQGMLNAPDPFTPSIARPGEFKKEDL